MLKKEELQKLKQLDRIEYLFLQKNAEEKDELTFQKFEILKYTFNFLIIIFLLLIINKLYNLELLGTVVKLAKLFKIFLYIYSALIIFDLIRILFFSSKEKKLDKDFKSKITTLK